MKRSISLIVLAICLGSIIPFIFFVTTQAQINAYTYFIPFPADQMDNLFDIANNDNNFIDEDIVTTVSISIQRDNTIIYYDQWEDGLEPNLTFPAQASTQVWGDNNPANGSPPGFAADVLQAGDVIAPQNTVILPRNSSNLFFDGGDKLTAVGGSIAVSLAVWPLQPSGPLFAGAWSLLPASTWGTDYNIPVGVDLYGTAPGQRAGFGVVAVNIQAVENGTTVQLDLDANGTVETTLTLNEGEQFTQTSGDARVGGTIRASAPVQVGLFTGNPDPGVNYEARASTLIPLKLSSDDYLVPRGLDGDFWLYNRHSTPLTITVDSSIAGTDTITVPANSTVQYPNGALSGSTGYRFRSVDGRSFEGFVALDPRDTRDWGYGLLPVSYLAPQVLVGWAPGNDNTPPGPSPGTGFESRVYVTALTTTIINVDYDIDGTIDATYPIAPLAEVYIYDPNDYDMTGAVLYTSDGVPFAAVWGQDPSATPARPSLDVGTGISPLASLAIRKSIELIDDADGSRDITWGDTVRFQIFVENNTGFALNPVAISDTLPASVSYNANTSTVRNSLISDDTTGLTIFPFDEGGYNIPGGLAAREILTATYNALVLENVTEIINQACADSPSVPSGGCDIVVAPVLPPILPTATPTVPPQPTDDSPTRAATFTPPPPAPSPTATATLAPVPGPTAALPVTFLPETGINQMSFGIVAWLSLLFFSVLGVAVWAILYKLRK